jgi:hypothetical protein
MTKMTARESKMARYDLWGMEVGDFIEFDDGHYARLNTIYSVLNTCTPRQ